MQQLRQVELKKEGKNYFLIYEGNKHSLSTRWIGLDRPIPCRAVISGIKIITKNESTIILFENTFAYPNALINFSFQINPQSREYDYFEHKRKILEIAKLLEGIEREYFIESIIKLTEWVNEEDHWFHVHLLFKNQVLPDIFKFLEYETNKGYIKDQIIRNHENTFVYDSSNLKVESDLLKIRQIQERGGKTVQVCCSNTIEILNMALDIELVNLEFNVFVESFHQHFLSGFAYNEFRVENKSEVNIDKLMVKIDRTVNLFKNPKLRSHFLKSIYDDAQKENVHETWAPMLLHFNNEFFERFNSEIEELSRQIVVPGKESDLISFAERYLFFLNGKTLSNQKYLSKTDYSRLIQYSNSFFTNLKLPKELQPVPSVHYKVGELRYVFYLMFKDKFPNQEYPESLFQFLESTFPNLKDRHNRNFRESANYKKFNSKPQYWDQLMEYNNK